MENRIFKLMLSVVTGMLFFSCSQTDGISADYEDGFIPMAEKSVEEIAEEVFISSAELADLSPEQLHYVRVDWILQQNIHLEGFEYVMDITSEEALKLGVTRTEYESYINEYKDLTKKLYAAKKAGHIVVPLDLKKACENRKEIYRVEQNK